MITYKPNSKTDVAVFLDGRHVGNIVKVADGWRYQVPGGEHGDTYHSLGAVKASLEGDD